MDYDQAAELSLTANLREIGEVLYGPRWQSELARAIGVSGRTMRRWAAGRYPVPDRIWRELDKLLQERKRQIIERLDSTFPGWRMPRQGG